MRIFRLAALKDVFDQAEFGTSDEIRNYIMSLSGRTQFLCVEYFKRMQPNVSLQSLEGIASAELRTEQDENSFAENRFAGYPELIKWYIKQLRQIRYSQPIENCFTSPMNIPEYSQAEAVMKSNFREIIDYYRNAEPAEARSLNHKSIPEVVAASVQWHREQALKGKNATYDPTDPNNVVYGPTWKGTNLFLNEEADGWTIQKITSENDLEVEGNRMNHCVASYWDAVESGDIFIFSLRDQGNIPHVTMETELRQGEISEFTQILGHSNSEPKSVYKAMIKEWIQNKFDTPPEFANTEGGMELFEHWNSELDDMHKAIESLFIPNEYGLLSSIPDDDDVSPSSLLDSIVQQAEKEANSGYSRYEGDYDGDVQVFAQSLIDMYLRMEIADSKSSKYFDDATNEPKSHERLYRLEHASYDLSQESSEELEKHWHWEPYMGDYPNAEEYEDEEWEAAVEKWQEEQFELEGQEQAEFMMKFSRHALPHDILSILHKMREAGEYPSWEELKAKYDPDPVKSLNVACKIYRLQK